MSPTIRLAHWADIPAMSRIFTDAFFENNDLCGRFMHPYRHEFPEDLFKYWQRKIRGDWMAPNAWYIVAVVRKSQGSGLRKEGEEGEERMEGADGEEGEEGEEGRGEEEIVGVAKWIRQGPGAPKVVQPWGTALLRTALSLHNHISTLLRPNRAANPSHTYALEAAFPLVAHYWTGPRAETYFLDGLGVSPSHQGQGHGRKLVEWGLERAEKEGVCASTTAAEEKDGFYGKLGFREVGRANVGVLEEVKGGAIMFCDRPGVGRR